MAVLWHWNVSGLKKEKRFAAGGTHQPHPYVHLVCMHADGGR